MAHRIVEDYSLKLKLQPINNNEVILVNGNEMIVKSK